ncbi:MAG: HEAT repeat domain-containing protein [Tepidisphaeraceae bacterium]
MRRDLSIPVRLQAIEAMWRLGDTDARDKLVTGTLSKFPDDQIVCLLALAGPRNQEAMRYIRSQLTNDYTETKLAAARAAGMLGSDDGMAIALKAVESNDARQRSMAALALGAIGRSDVQSELRKLLEDRDASVRLAAATAVLQLKPPGAMMDN